jgi:predicted metal-dependent hydrolase
MAAIPYTVRRSARARRARIQVTAEGVEVIAPRRLPERDIEPFVESKQRWIERTLLRLREAEQRSPAARIEDGGEVPYLGERLTLRVTVDPARRRASVIRRAGALHVRVADGAPQSIRAALEGWYKAQARTEIAARLDAAVARVGAAYSGLQIRSQRTRWASCSSSGGMSFNWRLLLAPAEIVDYVVEHEVAHLEVHDHSDRFWSLLASRCPRYREGEAWLKANGHTLRI